ncbi:sulfite dehydrogenase (cytochrome) subunit SorA apoprotein [Pseudonocardia sediminis]|uniref:Sulfite dehydrogenase (Cytochrome) subunit SorA apoprotein n=1 Tax=Pseudonocardia sediminis TaxID=1397368 RepID=A0A4Q7UZ26_PSEST|nr:sulfite oxidase [Pseudonocardia sediminis]RZT86358.1 sulfite dehydrogenase (cytochrome) subunit SorA apoprotein [Pseudonocardia sediminis]
MISPAKRDDMLVHQSEPYNAEPPRGALADDVVTPIAAFYGRNHGTFPDTDAATWRLCVGGMVDRPLELSLDDLRSRFTRHEEIATLQCAGNRRAGLMAVHDIPGQHPWGPGATSTARWAGARLADVLDAAGLDPAATDIAFDAPDVADEADPPQGFGGSIGVGKATAGEVLLAWEMNGEPLPVAHGAPVRVVVPGHIGARSVKWVETITARDRPSDNFFQATAYRLLPADTKDPGPGDGVALGAVALNSEILRPDDGDEVPAGPTAVTGYAFAGEDRTIIRVDVSADGGDTWVQADLDEQLGPWTWRLWHATVDVPAGRTTITARAWDSSAALQPEHPASVWNPKGYVNNSWPAVTVTGR